MMRSLGRALTDDRGLTDDGDASGGNESRPAWCDELPPDGPEWSEATDGAAWSEEDNAARAALVNEEDVVNFRQICSASEEDARAFLQCHSGLDAAIAAYVEEHDVSMASGHAVAATAVDDDAVAKVAGICSTDVDTARAFLERYGAVDAAVEVSSLARLG